VRTKEAKALIADVPFRADGQRWMDLGCGDGVFTLALAELLPAGSTIEAWDINGAALENIPVHHSGVGIQTRTIDFLRTDLPSGMDGILLANALHFVADQQRFLNEVGNALTPGGLLLVAEYDTEIPVPTWVPHPIGKRRLATLLSTHGSNAPTLIGKRPSTYGRGDLYTVFAERSASSDP